MQNWSSRFYIFRFLKDQILQIKLLEVQSCQCPWRSKIKDLSNRFVFQSAAFVQSIKSKMAANRFPCKLSLRYCSQLNFKVLELNIPNHILGVYQLAVVLLKVTSVFKSPISTKNSASYIQCRSALKRYQSLWIYVAIHCYWLWYPLILRSYLIKRKLIVCSCVHNI